MGDPALGVPRYNVTTANLASPQTPHSLSGTPVWLAYDSADNSFWVASLPSSVDVVPANNTTLLSGTVSVGTAPFGVAVDVTANVIFVTNTGSDNVSVISGSTDLPTGAVGVGSEPMGIAYDPANARVFVADSGSNNVTVFSARTLSVVANVNVGFSPIGLAYDPATRDVFVADSGSYEVSVLSGSTNQVLATVPVGIEPYGVAVDTTTDNIYVSNQGSSNVSVINASRDSIVATIPVVDISGLSLQGIAFDNRTDQIWIGGGSSSLVLLNTTAEAVAYFYSTDPSGVAFDPSTGTMCFTNSDNQTFECYTQLTPQSGTVPITFSETGLPRGAVWNVSADYGPSQSSNTSQIVFPVMGSSYWSFGFRIPWAGRYEPATAQFKVNVSNSPVIVAVAFHLGPTEYPVRFLETGLVTGMGWNLALNNTVVQESTAASMTFDEANGTYLYSAGTVPNYMITSTGFQLQVLGTATGATISFDLATGAFEFFEVGLPSIPPNGNVNLSVLWYVNMTSGPTGFALPSSGPIMGSSTTLALANGSYTYTAQSANKGYRTEGAGAFVLYQEFNAELQITFTNVTEAVVFEEEGLPAGTNWSVSLAGTPENSTTANITFSVPNGTYPFAVGGVPGYAPRPRGGTITVVASGPPALVIVFTSTETYAATFHENGLPAGTGWSVAIGSQFESSLTDNVTLTELNGTYGYVVEVVAGFTTTSFGQVSILGQNVTVPVIFTVEGSSPGGFPLVIPEVGLPSGSNWSITVSDAGTDFTETHTSVGSILVFYLRNGTYSISVEVPVGFTASPSSWTIIVQGELIAVSAVEISPTQGPQGAAPGMAPTIPAAYWWALGGTVALVLVLAALLLLFRRRPPRPAPP
ncbi:MAG: hypothetical protein ACYDFT_00475 [Thermoplasmata archaeon]